MLSWEFLLSTLLAKANWDLTLKALQLVVSTVGICLVLVQLNNVKVALQSGTYQKLHENQNKVWDAIAGKAELMEKYTILIGLASTDGKDRDNFRMLCLILNNMENVHYQYRTNAISKRMWVGWHGYINKIKKHELYDQYWPKLKGVYCKEFIDYMDGKPGVVKRLGSWTVEAWKSFSKDKKGLENKVVAPPPPPNA